MCWMSGDDPLKMEAFTKMPTLEYCIMVDKKLAQAKKEIRAQQK